jgi:hypothetical protein
MRESAEKRKRQDQEVRLKESLSHLRLSRAVTTHNINKQRPAASARELFSQSPISPQNSSGRETARNYTVCINNLYKYKRNKLRNDVISWPYYKPCSPSTAAPSLQRRLRGAWSRVVRGPGDLRVSPDSALRVRGSGVDVFRPAGGLRRARRAAPAPRKLEPPSVKWKRSLIAQHMPNKHERKPHTSTHNSQFIGHFLLRAT